MQLKALIWDVDGTLAETERDGHRVAFNHAFAEHGLAWQWSVDDYRARLATTGGRERIVAEMALRNDGPAGVDARDALARSLHAAKNRHYAALANGVLLRAGVQPLLDACSASGVALAIATTTSADNVDALLAARLGARWRERFAAVVCGEDVLRKKPDAEVYRIALARLGLTADRCVAIEDSPAGVDAARGAGLAVVVTRSVYFADDAVAGATAVGPGLGVRDGWTPPLAPGAGGVTLADIEHWLQRLPDAAPAGPNR